MLYVICISKAEGFQQSLTAMLYILLCLKLHITKRGVKYIENKNAFRSTAVLSDNIEIFHVDKSQVINRLFLRLSNFDKHTLFFISHCVLNYILLREQF